MSDESDFGLTDPRDLLQGGVIPAFREDYFEIEDGVFALALGDAHVVVDPIMGLGANIAAYSAGVVADCIIDSGGIFDELFCDQVARARAEVLIGASQWTNLMLQQHPRVSDVMRAAARKPDVGQRLHRQLRPSGASVEDPGNGPPRGTLHRRRARARARTARHLKGRTALSGLSASNAGCTLGTDGVAPELRVDRRRELVSQLYVPLSADTTSPDFGGNVRMSTLGATVVSRVTAGPHTVHRSKAMIAASERGYYKLGLQLEGDAVLSQGDRQVVLRPGDFAVYDTDKPYSMAFTTRPIWRSSCSRASA